MANKSVFASTVGKLAPRTDTVNEAGGPAYRLSPKQALAQLATTGTFNATYYAGGEAQVDKVLELATEVEAEFLAKAAIYAFEKGHMKDMPSMLLALLATMQGPEFVQAFPRIVTNGRMLRNFVQIMRSGVVGRKSLGTRPKKLVQAWLNQASDQMLLNASVGNDPSLPDVIKMVHPKPQDPRREALYAWLIDKPHDFQALPESVREFEAFKSDLSRPVPDVPFQMLTSLKLTTVHWVQIAHKASWQMLRQNLNAFIRHGAFEVEGFTNYIAGRIADKDEIGRARVFPYQLMMAHGQVSDAAPPEIIQALEDSMEIALSNLPKIAGNVVVCPDVSGSMSSSVTGYRKGASSKVRCIDVAALTAAAILRSNPSARIMPFAVDVVKLDLDPEARIMVNAQKLALIGGGGTDCSAPLAKLAQEKAKVDLALFVSDNESWVKNAAAGQRGTKMMEEWQKVKAINPGAKLICIDIQPYTSTQAPACDDVLNVGGFSDAVFEVVAQMLNFGGSPDHWVDMIETISL